MADTESATFAKHISRGLRQAVDTGSGMTFL
jgi:hypothetical protein